MAISIKHKFTSALPDSVDTSLIRPSNWNDTHDIVMATARLLGRITAGTGSAEEISVAAPLLLSGTSLSMSYTPVNQAGDTMAGDLIFPTNLGPRLNSTGGAGARRVKITTDNVSRWQFGGDGTAETGAGNVGSNFVLNRHDDAGAVIDTPFSVNRSTGVMNLRNVNIAAGPFTSLADLELAKTFPQMRLNKTANTQSSSIAGQLNGLNLWNAVLGVGNAAGNFQLNAYNDAGAFLATRFEINRLTGDAVLQGTFTMGDIVLKRVGAEGADSAVIIGTNSAGQALWSVEMPSADGSFAIGRFNKSTGAYIDTPFGISEDDGSVTLGSPTALTTALGSFKYIKSILLASGTDVDTITDAAPCYTGPGLVNGPITMSGTSWAYLEVLRFSNDANYVLQKWTAMNIGGADGNPPTWYRYKLAGNWSEWYPLSGFVTPRHFAAAGSRTAAGATSAQTGPLTSFLNSPYPKYLDQWYRIGGVIAVDMDLQPQNGWQLFGFGAQTGLVMAGGGINLTNADVPNPTGTVSDEVTLKDFMMVKVGYDATVPLTIAFKDGDTGSSMPSLQMDNVHLTAATTTDGCSGAHVALHNCRNSQVSNCSVFGRYGTYNGNAFQLTGGANSASVEVYFNNCRANHVQKGFYVGPSGGAVANDDMQGIHWHKCTAIAVDRGWEIQGGAEGFGEWFALDACHAYFREIGVYGVNAGNIRSDHGYYLGHGNLATIQGIAITGTSIEPWNALTYNRIRLDAATGASRLGINANAQTGIAQGNRVSNATTAYTFAAGWTNANNS